MDHIIGKATEIEIHPNNMYMVVDVCTGKSREISSAP
jgi:hypothetical protein